MLALGVTGAAGLVEVGDSFANGSISAREPLDALGSGTCGGIARGFVFFFTEGQEYSKDLIAILVQGKTMQNLKVIPIEADRRKPG